MEEVVGEVFELNSPVVCHQRLTQAELSEHVDDCLHRGRVGDGDWSHVQDFLQL